MLDSVLAGHFVRQGAFELAHMYAQESGLVVNAGLKAQFSEMVTQLHQLSRLPSLMLLSHFSLLLAHAFNVKYTFV